MHLNNPYQNVGTRRITLDSTNKTKVLDFDSDTGQTWQAWLFSNSASNKSTLVSFVLRGSFGTSGTIETTIGGGDHGGDLITGTGACEVFATGSIGNDISIWFTPELTTKSLPSISQGIQLGVAFSVQNFGYPPFGREQVSIKTTDPFELLFKDDSGTIVYQEFIDPTIGGGNTFMDKIFHPPNTTLEIISSVANQNIIITHSIN